MSPAREGVAGARFDDPLSAFYIPATAESEGNTTSIALKQGDSFAVLDPAGNIPKTERKSTRGVFFNDMRHISGLDLLLEGRRPLLLSSSVSNDNVLFSADLANPDIYRNGALVLSRENLHIVRSTFLWDGTFNQRINIQNFDLKAHRARLLVWFDCDFIDLFEVRGVARAARGTRQAGDPKRDSVTFSYLGLDRTERKTRIHFEPQPSALTENYAAYDLSLEPHESVSICFSADFANASRGENLKLIPKLLGARRAVRKRASDRASITSGNDAFNKFVSQSVSDLDMLVTETPHGPYPCAGIPWFSTPFGRDGIIVALQALSLNPALARGVLSYLAATQAQDDDPSRDAEPGKILHETRRCEMARTGEVPFGQYYGSVDSTPLFIVLAGRYFQRTGDLSTIRALWPSLRAALDWIDGPADRDRDGFIEYRARTKQGLGNQGWKDSADSVMHSDGRLAEGSIALCEVQAYVFSAKRHAAVLASALGHTQESAMLTRQAEELRARFENSFWCDELGTYALALDGDKKPCRVRASNAGQVLFGGIASQERAKRVAETLMRRESFSGWGIRTLAQSEKRFNPMSYHNGSVWPHDNSLIGLGLATYGEKRAVLSIFRGLFASTHYLADARLPELFCGFPRRPGQAPTRYPVACSPQAWASGTVFALIDAMLGLEVDALRREIRFCNPVLPREFDRLTIDGLALGDKRVDLCVTRQAETVAVEVLGSAHDISVVVKP